MADQDPPSFRVSRRHMLGGIAALPAAVAAAPTAAAGVIAQSAMPAVARAAMASGLDMDKIVNWMVDDYNHNSTIDDYADYASSLFNILGNQFKTMDVLRIVGGPANEYDLGMDSLMHVKDIFSPEAKFAYFMRYKQPGESIDGWLDSPLFHGPGSSWRKSLKLLDAMGISPDSSLSLEEFMQLGKREIAKKVGPTLQTAIRRDPRIARDLLKEWKNEGLLQEVQEFLKDIAPEHDASAWDALLEQAQESLQLVPMEVVRLKDKEGKSRYSIILEGHHAHARDYLGELSPALHAPEVQWWENSVTVPKDSAADRVLAQLAVDSAVPPPQVMQAVHVGTALQCAATARELKR